MKILEQLDSQVDALLHQLSQAKAENASLRAQTQNLKSTIAALEEKNRSLTDKLARGEAKCAKALEHLDRLIVRIQDYDQVE
ncbi:MAG: cell division protein ZapB [Desulfovibrio sp.]|nr:cell division protein ZapB [Desulfovibrio sp.]